MQKTISKQEKTRLIFFFLLLIGTLFILVKMPRLSIPLSLGYLISLLLNPLVPLVMKTGVGRTLSIIILFIAVAFFAIFPLIRLAPSLSNEFNNLNNYIPKMELFIKDKYGVANDVLKEKTGFEIDKKYIDDGFFYLRKKLTEGILEAPKLLASFIEWIFIVPLFSFFLMKDLGGFKKLILRIVPNSIFERFYYLSHQFNKQLGDYIFAKFIEASLVGLMVLSGLLFFNVRFAVILALVAAVTNIIPYVGPILGSVPALLFAMAEYGLSAKTGFIGILLLGANAVDIAIIFPVLVSKIVNLHPVVVVVSVILGSQYFGVVGMIISIPFATALKLIMQEIYNELYNHRFD